MFIITKYSKRQESRPTNKTQNISKVAFLKMVSDTGTLTKIEGDTKDFEDEATSVSLF